MLDRESIVVAADVENDGEGEENLCGDADDVRGHAVLKVAEEGVEACLLLTHSL